MAKALGLRVIAIDARDEGLALARSCSADLVLDARIGKEHVVSEVQKATGGRGADATINMSDASSAAALAAAVTRMHGCMVQIAQPTEVVIPFTEIVFRDVRVVGSLTSSCGEAQKMLKLVAEHGIKVETNPFEGLKEVGRCVELAHSGNMKGKGVILIDREAIEKEKQSGIDMI